MEHSTQKSQTNPDAWTIGEDSPSMTIDYLRARLLSERSISKAAKERSDELSYRVKELEDQLKAVSLQRKKAENATLDVLSYLESHGVSDMSELYESESDQDDFLCESNTGKSHEGKSFGSDHESAPSSTGSLSWKGRKKTAQLVEKKYFDSPTRRQISSPLANSSPKRRHGKSCRQIKRRETRSVVEEPSHDSLKSDTHDSSTLDSANYYANYVDTRNDKLKQSPDKQAEICCERNEVPNSFEDPTRGGDASSSNRGHERNGEMERALKHQAQLIGLYEAQEKAQRDWEDKYGDNQVSTQDSCEPGSHSDVTEDREENKAGVPHPAEITAHHVDHKEGSEANVQSKQSSITHFNSFKLLPGADELTGMQSSTSPTLDFVFPTINNNQTQKHEDSHAVNVLYESHPENVNGNRSIVRREEPQSPGGILSALQEAKLILEQQLCSLRKSSASASKSVESSISAINDVDWLNIPVACPSLFRVPTDLPSQAVSPSRSLVLDSSRHLSDSYGYGRTSYVVQGHHNMFSSMDSRISTANGDTSNRNPAHVIEVGNSSGPRLDFQYKSNQAFSRSGFLPNSNIPDFLMSPDRILSSKPPRSEVGMIPPSGNPLFYNHDVRPNMY